MNTNTTYEEIYGLFRMKITDYQLPMLIKEEEDEIMLSYLKYACSNFRHCPVDLSNRNDELAQFNFKIKDDIIDVITENMIVLWLKPFLNNEENLFNQISTTDYSLYSPANLLKQISDVYNTARKNARTLVNEISFIYANPIDLLVEE